MACPLTAQHPRSNPADGHFNNNSPDAESTRPNRRFFTLRIIERICDNNIKYSANRNWIKYTGTPFGLKRMSYFHTNFFLTCIRHRITVHSTYTTYTVKDLKNIHIIFKIVFLVKNR